MQKIFKLLCQLLEYSDNYSIISQSLRNCHRDEVYDSDNEHNTDNYRSNNSKSVTNKPFECKAKILGSTPANNNILYTELVIPLKYLNKFWRYYNLILINCKIELKLS